MTLLPLPSDLGLDPERFPSFRDGQADLAVRLAYSLSRFPMLDAPCGWGKSLVYLTSHLLRDEGRLLVLTPSKHLQDQLTQDFPQLTDVRGQSNYTCPHHGNCEIGANAECPLRRVGTGEPNRCSNLQAIDRGRAARRVVTNRAFWFTQGKLSSTLVSDTGSPPPGIGQFDVIVVDEGHDIAEDLAEFCTISLIEREVESYLPISFPSNSTTSLTTWSHWAREALKTLPPALRAAGSGRTKHRLVSIGRALTDLAGLASDPLTWIYQEEDGKHSWTPVWAGPYAERLLFQGARQVILTSATLPTNLPNYLEIEPEEVEFISAPNLIPMSSRPIIYIPSPQISFNTKDSQFRVAVSTIDAILDAWKGYRGLIQTQSYWLMEKILSFTRNRNRLLVCEQGDSASARAAIDHLKRRVDDRWAIGPVYKEGIDLPGDSAQAQITAKIPQVNRKNPVIAARCKSNPGYAMDQTALEVRQIAGRIVRGPRDRGVGYITDGHLEWIIKEMESRWPPEFRKSVRWETGGIAVPAMIKNLG